MTRSAQRWLVAIILLGLAAPVGAQQVGGGQTPLWLWSLALLACCFAIGVVAVVAGIGGGVLYVPLVDALFPFHLDFVRGAGLWIAVAGALSSGPRLLRLNLATLRLAVPCALTAALGSLLGAQLGLRIPKWLVQDLLGVLVILIAVVMLRSKEREAVDGRAVDPWARRLQMLGAYHDPLVGGTVRWAARRVRLGLLLVFGIGILGGVFGVGAGWAKVPTLALVMGVPLKVATASSVFLISLGDVAGAWVYLHQGSVLPFMVVPSTIGLMFGAKVGARLLERARPEAVRKVVFAVLLFAGARSLLAGLGIWGG
ncbi:MAG: sulfite exporter TauE/SafE family protein [Fimbriimonadaceae bacterium]|nr:sulfite exporter TauE/SafE family protein [Fimbriimonadaceae bacterium]